MKKRVGICITAVLLMMVGCTVVSLKNYVKGLNRVMVISSVPNQIRDQVVADGTAYFAKVEALELPDGCRIVETFVETGDIVSEGLPILQLDMTDLTMAYYEIQVQQERLEDSGTSEAEEMLLELTLQDLEKQEEWLQSLIQQEGILYAEEPCQITELRIQENVIEVGVPSEGYYLEWYIDAAEYRPFTSMKAELGASIQDIPWKPERYQNGVYQYTTPVMELPEELEFVHGQHVQVTMQYISEEYENVLPKSCVQYEGDGASYVYQLEEQDKAYGKEYYVRKVGVTVLDQNDSYVAVLAGVENVVVHSERELLDLEAVQVVD